MTVTSPTNALQCPSVVYTTQPPSVPGSVSRSDADKAAAVEEVAKRQRVKAIIAVVLLVCMVLLGATLFLQFLPDMMQWNFKAIGMARPLVSVTCADTPCYHGSMCVASLDGRTFTCTCTAGYTGTNCANNIADCTAYPCKNNGLCDKTGWPPANRCRCETGLAGFYCEVDTADCVMYPCYNGGTCIVTSSTVNRCQCASNYSGLLCQTPVT